MVVFELAAGKTSIAVAAGGLDALAKAFPGSSAAGPALLLPAVLPSGTGAASAVLLPLAQPTMASLLPVGLSPTGLLQSFHGISTGVVTALSHIKLTSFVAPAATMSLTCGAWAVYAKDWDKVADEDDSSDGTRVLKLNGFNAWVTSFLATSALTDSYMVGVLFQSLGQPLESPLRLWAVGGLLLSFPCSYLVKLVNDGKPENTKEAFVLEAFLTALAFTWLFYGARLLGDYPMDAHSAPLLFWSCFAQIVLSCSALSTGIVTVAGFTVASHLCQQGH